LLQAREEQLNSLVDYLTLRQAGADASGLFDPKVSQMPSSLYNSTHGTLNKRACLLRQMLHEPDHVS